MHWEQSRATAGDDGPGQAQVVPVLGSVVSTAPVSGTVDTQMGEACRLRDHIDGAVADSMVADMDLWGELSRRA